MDILINNCELAEETIEMFFDEEKVKKYLFKKSKDDPIRFPWETRAPRVYKYKQFFIKVYGLQRRYHFVTGSRMGNHLLFLHNYLNKNDIKTVFPHFIGIKGKYSVVVTPNIEDLNLTLLSNCDVDTIIKSTITIHNKLSEVDLYHGDNKPDNSTINLKIKEVVLLDIDSLRIPKLITTSRKKLKRKTEESLNRKLKRLNDQKKVI